jgi:1,4-dihydroxy-2-naphthoate octaprenyltransferase
MRPKILIIPFSGVFLGIFGSTILSQKLNWLASVFTVLTALSLTVFSNFVNDYYDGKNGVDKNRLKGAPKRYNASPLGLEIAKRNSIISFTITLLFGTILLITIAFSLGILTAFLFLLLGLFSLLAAYGYTGGKIKYGYIGLGELFCFLFHGIIAANGAFFINSAGFSRDIFALSIIQGILAVQVLAANNIRDYETDKKSNKKTLCVLMGLKNYEFFLNVIGFIPIGLLFSRNNIAWFLIIPLFITQVLFTFFEKKKFSLSLVQFLVFLLTYLAIIIHL